MGRLQSALTAAVAAAALCGLAGCGSNGNVATDAGGSTVPTTPVGLGTSTGPAGPTSSAAALPGCGDVWVAGHTLPRTYAGCQQGGVEVPAKTHPCSFGSAIVEFDDRFYAVAGKFVNEIPHLSRSTQFHQALTACQA